MGGAWPVGGVRRTTTTSRAAAALFAKTRTANRDKISGRAARGTGPGLAATTNNARNTVASMTGTINGGPSRSLPGTRT